MAAMAARHCSVPSGRRHADAQPDAAVPWQACEAAGQRDGIKLMSHGHVSQTYGLLSQSAACACSQACCLQALRPVTTA